MCKLFKINARKDFKKPVIFLKLSNYFNIELAQGNWYRYCLASFSDFGILDYFALSYNGNNSSVKLFKVTMSRKFDLQIVTWFIFKQFMVQLKYLLQK